MIKSGFFKNVLALFKGNVVFQMTIVFTLIFLARHYTPEEIGRYAVFVSIITIISTVAAGRLEMAIMLPKHKQEAFNVFVTGTVIISIVSLISLVAFGVLFYNKLFFKSSSILITFVLFFGIFFAAYNNLILQYLNRHEKFKIVSNGKIIGGLVIASTQILSVFFYKNIFYLVFAYSIGFMSSSLYYIFHINNLLKDLKFSFNVVMPTINKYKSFTTLNNMSSLLNIVANQGPVIFIEVIYGSAISGFYSVVQRTLNAPASLIGTAFSQVFYKKITGDISKKRLKQFMNLSLKYLFILAITIFIIVLFFSEYIYVYVFGSDYIISAIIAKIMVVFFLVRLIFSSMSTLVIAKNKLALDLKFNLVYVFALISPILLGYLFNFNYLTVIKIITITGTLCFLFLGYILFRKL